MSAHHSRHDNNDTDNMSILTESYRIPRITGARRQITVTANFSSKQVPLFALVPWCSVSSRSIAQPVFVIQDTQLKVYADIWPRDPTPELAGVCDCFAFHLCLGFLTIVLLNCQLPQFPASIHKKYLNYLWEIELLRLFVSIFIHLKLEVLTQFPASNDEKYYIFLKNRPLSVRIVCP